MRILLINPPIETDLFRGSFPLGLGYIGSSLLEDNHEVKVLDINGHNYNKEQVEKILEVFLKKYDVIGISGMVSVYNYIKWLISKIKECKKESTVIVGGTVSTPMPKLLLEKTEADVACIGEGEITIKELIYSLENSGDLSKIKGIYYKKDGKIHQTMPRERIEDLDNIPFPAWDLFPIKYYIEKPMVIDGPLRSMNIISGRGCPYRCIFCYRNFGNKVILRSVDNVIEEIKLLKEKYNIHHIEFQDELFTINEKRVREFCIKLIKEKIDITWRSLGRVNIVTNFDLSTLKLMKKAGCHWIGYGMESGSQKMLDMMHKNITVNQIEKAISFSRKAGINVSGTFMIGMPGETRDTIQETVEFCKKNKIFNVPFFTVPYPGTFLYQKLLSDGFIKDEEEFIKKMDKDATNLIVNMTDFSDEELIYLKKKAEEDIYNYIYQRKSLRKLNSYKIVVSDIITRFSYWGYESAIRGMKKCLKVLC